MNSAQVFHKARAGETYEAAGSVPEAAAGADRWLRTLHALLLSPVQREHLLTLRARQLAKLGKLTDARRLLSMQVSVNLASIHQILILISKCLIPCAAAASAAVLSPQRH